MPTPAFAQQRGFDYRAAVSALRSLATVASLLMLISISRPAVAELQRLRPASARGFEGYDDVGPLPAEARVAKLLARFSDRTQRLVALPRTDQGTAHASSAQVYRGRRYAPEHVLDRNPRTAWVEAEPGPGPGSWIEIELTPTPRSRLFGVLVVGGFARNPTMFRNNPRPREALLTLRCEGGPLINYRLLLDDTRRPQLFVLGPHQRVRATGPCRLRFTHLKVYPGERFEDASITALRLVVSEAAQR